MTNTVKRGAGRPAATAKSTRHAQRTPLPPKAGQVADAKAAIADAKAERYGMTSVAGLRLIAKGHGIKGYSRMDKGALLTAILAAEAAASRAEAKVDATLRSPKLDAKLDGAFGETAREARERRERLAQRSFEEAAETDAELDERIDSKSGAKATAFAAEALRLGWKAEASLAAGDLVTVTATRDEEAITIQWLGGVFQDNCSYRHNGRTPIKLRNASAAKQRMAVPPARANEEAAKVTAHKAVKARASRPTSGGRRLPFTESSLDQEVLDAVYGKRVIWTNRVSSATEEDRVPALAENVRLNDGTPGRKKQHHAPRIAEGPHGRVLEFVGASGFRTVLVSQITAVR